MNEKIKINWYRTPVDKAVMSDLMRKSDARAFAQVIPQLALFAATGTLAFLAYRNINATNWTWSPTGSAMSNTIRLRFTTTMMARSSCHRDWTGMG